MTRRFLVGLLLAALVSGLAPQLGAAPPDPGILRISTTLPRTLPLHIRSPDGLSILVDVTDAVSGAEVMRAFGKGGAMFRVLLPPGQFRLRIAVGRDWRDETSLFGPDTRITEIGPLDFAITGRAKRNGHLITILPDGGATLAVVEAPLAVCQGWQAQIDRAEPVDRPLDGWPDLPTSRRLYSFSCG